MVFVGGSLVATGGHNVLEPAVFGKPIVFGPHMENFAEIAEAFVANGAGVQVRVGAASSSETFVALHDDPVRRARLGAAARALVEANRGAKDKTLGRARGAAAARRAGGLPVQRPARSRPACLIILYGQVAARRRRRAERHPERRRRLARPGRSASATSSVGGTGKTPLVAAIAAWLVATRRAARDPEPRLRARGRPPTAWSSSRDGRAFWPASTARATSR